MRILKGLFVAIVLMLGAAVIAGLILDRGAVWAALVEAWNGLQGVAGLFELIVLALVCGLVGWLTNAIALFCLFHPERELFAFKQVGLGVFPRMKPHLAKEVATIVGERLLTKDGIAEMLTAPGMHDAFRAQTAHELAKLIDSDLPSPRELLKTELGITSAVYERRDRLSALALQTLGSKLSEEQIRTELSLWIEGVLYQHRHAQVGAIVDRDKVRKKAELLVSKLLPCSPEQVGELRQWLVERLDRPGCLRESLPPSAEEEIRSIVRELTPVLLRHLAKVLEDPEAQRVLLGKARELIQQTMDQRQGPAWRMARFFGLDATVLRRLFDQLPIAMSKLPHKLEEPGIQALVAERLDAVVDRALELPYVQARQWLLDPRSAAVVRIVEEMIAELSCAPSLRPALVHLLDGLLDELWDMRIGDLVDLSSYPYRRLCEVVASVASDGVPRHDAFEEVVLGVCDEMARDEARSPEVAARLRQIRRRLSNQATDADLDVGEEQWRDIVARLTGLGAEQCQRVESLTVSPRLGVGELELRQQDSKLPKGALPKGELPLEVHCRPAELGGLSRWVVLRPGGASDYSSVRIRFSPKAPEQPELGYGEDEHGPYLELRLAGTAALGRGLERLDGERFALQELTRFVRLLREARQEQLASGRVAPRVGGRFQRLQAWLWSSVDEAGKRIEVDDEPLFVLDALLGLLSKKTRQHTRARFVERSGSTVQAAVDLLARALGRSHSQKAVHAGLTLLIDRALDFRLGRLRRLLDDKTWQQIEVEAADVLIHFAQSRGQNLATMLNFTDLVETKIMQASNDEVETLVKERIAGKAFVALEALGGVLGAAAGVVLYFFQPVISASIQVVIQRLV